MRPSTAPESTTAIPSQASCHVTSILPVAAIKAGTLYGEPQLTHLPADITKRGLVEPIGVIVDGPDYRVVFGNRRFAAVKRLGWTEVPAKVLAGLDKALRALDRQDQ